MSGSTSACIALEMAAKSLLDSNPSPTEDEVKEWMMGNLCRCTGYYQIMESILKASK